MAALAASPAGADVLLWSRLGPSSESTPNPSQCQPPPPFISNIASKFDHTYRCTSCRTALYRSVLADYAIITVTRFAHHSTFTAPLLATHGQARIPQQTRARLTAQHHGHHGMNHQSRDILLSTDTTAAPPAILTRWCARCSRCALANRRPPPRPTSRPPCHGHWQRSAPARRDGTRPATTRPQG